ncbi:nucleoside-diphosphate kinase [Candidatus Woesearchaeota archaeon]|nr:nucleoside-diphosphate kinase [Candidatus Woesearchaeota archaeon]
MIERSLVVLKPDAVKRGLMGRIISRFEDAGLKVVGAKMVWVDEHFGNKHYEEIGKLASRRGETILKVMLKFMTSGPVFAFCVEGVNAVDNVRKIVGGTEPKSALPGTIRGDFSHVSFAYADKEGKAIENLIHASGSVEEAKQEIALWFTQEELHTYKTVHEAHTL